MTYPLIGNYGRLARRRPVRPGRGCGASSSPTRPPRSSTTRASSRRCCATNGIPAIAGVDTRALARHLRANGCLRGDHHRARRDRPRRRRRRARAVAALGGPGLRRPGLAGGGRARWATRRTAPLVAIVDFGLKANIVRVAAPARRARPRPARTRPPRPTCWPPTSRASSSRPAPAIRRGSTVPWRSRGRSSTTAGRCSGSASATRSSAARRARRRAAPVRPPRREPPGPGPRHRLRPGDRAEPRGPGRRRQRCPAASGFRVSQLNLNDRSVEGLRHAEKPIETVQYHPEGAPGPLDALAVFDRFVDACRRGA